MAGRELRVDRDEVLSDAKKAGMRRCVPSAGGAAGAAAVGKCWRLFRILIMSWAE